MRREKVSEFSVFVFNLPRTLDRFGLYGIFKKAGSVSDSYIPYHQKKGSRGIYGFVRFYKREDAWRSIKLLYGGSIRGMRINVSMANPKKKGQRSRNDQITGNVKRSKHRLEWRRKLWVDIQKEATQGQEEQSHIIKITGQTNEEFEEWLQRSLVCTTEEPRDMAALASALMAGFGQSFRLSALSSFSFLLTFPSIECLNVAMEYQQELQQWFSHVKRWGMEDCCDTRRVWLDIVGVPPHGWKWENFKKIAELWGKFISLGKPSSNTESFEVMKVLIATRSFQRIEAEVLLFIGYGGYKVMVKEAEMLSQVVNKIHHYAEDREDDNQRPTNDIPGFEDIDDNISIQEVEDAEVDPKAIQKTANRVEDEEPPRSKESNQHAASLSRTKTASFSQNGYSQELLKMEHLSRALVNSQGIEESQQESDNHPPPGFEFALGKFNHDQGIQTRSMTKCKEKQKRAEVADLSEPQSPLGLTNAEKTNLGQNTQEGQKKDVQTLNFKEALVQSNSGSTSSTSESLVNLAYKSLQFGELLGVRVTGNVEAAVSRITSPLKKNRKQARRSKQSTKD